MPRCEPGCGSRNKRRGGNGVLNMLEFPMQHCGRCNFATVSARAKRDQQLVQLVEQLARARDQAAQGRPLPAVAGQARRLDQHAGAQARLAIEVDGGARGRAASCAGKGSRR